MGLKEAFILVFVNTKSSEVSFGLETQPKMTDDEKKIINVDEEDVCRCSSRKRTEKEVFDPSVGKTKTKSTQNNKRKTGATFSDTIRKTASSDLQTITVLVNVRIKTPDRNNDGLFVYPLSQNIPATIVACYVEIEDLSEPVLELQHRTNSSTHETFRAMVPFPALTIVFFNTAASPLPTPPLKSFLLSGRK